MNNCAIPNNLCERFFAEARNHPNKIALVEPLTWSGHKVTAEKLWTYQEFARAIEGDRRRLEKLGFRAGDRVLVMLPIGARLYSLVAALFANGLVPVFFDHVMESKQFRWALKHAGLKAVFSTREFLRYRIFLPALWRIKCFALADRGLGFADWHNISPPKIDSSLPLTESSLPVIAPDDTSLITFTSGSSGRPKAANRTHGILFHQRDISRRLWTENAGTVELTLFPMVVFSNLVYGVTTVLPAARLEQPDSHFAERLAAQVARHQVSRLAVTPSSLAKICELNSHSHAGLRSVRRLVTGGAPVPRWLIRKANQAFAGADGFVVYGSTEAEPISHAAFADVLDSRGEGYLVGKPISDIELKIDSGEILLTGPHVVKNYLFNDDDNRSTKILDSSGVTWHRTRDVGHFDRDGRLWLTGRLGDRIRVRGELRDVFAAEHELENLIEARVALVQKMSASSAHSAEATIDLFTERDPAGLEKTRQIKFTDIASAYNARVHLIDKIPVDRRHFWKINRQALHAPIETL